MVASTQEGSMKIYVTVALSMLTGFSLGAVAIGGLNAQTKPGAYAIVDISEVTDPNILRQQLLPKAEPAATSAGGRFIARTENIVALTGAPPKRFIIIAFESVDKAKAWDATPAQQEVNVLAEKSLKSRRFIVEGM
jgi:uncharacterized protein (DUF1330 family)